MLIGLGLAVAIVGFLHLFANLVARRVVKILREAWASRDGSLALDTSSRSTAYVSE